MSESEVLLAGKYCRHWLNGMRLIGPLYDDLCVAIAYGVIKQ